MSKRYSPSAPVRDPHLALERWLLLAIVIGCLLTAIIAFGAYRLATGPVVPSVTPPASLQYREGQSAAGSLPLSAAAPPLWFAPKTSQPRGQACPAASGSPRRPFESTPPAPHVWASSTAIAAMWTIERTSSPVCKT